MRRRSVGHCFSSAQTIKMKSKFLPYSKKNDQKQYQISTNHTLTTMFFEGLDLEKKKELEKLAMYIRENNRQLELKISQNN